MHVRVVQDWTNPLLPRPLTHLYVEFYGDLALSDIPWKRSFENEMEELARRDAKCQSCIIPFTSCQSAPRVSAGLEREVKLNGVVQVMEGARESVEYKSLQTLIIIIIAHSRSTELSDRLNSSLPTELLCRVFSNLLYLGRNT